MHRGLGRHNFRSTAGGGGNYLGNFAGGVRLPATGNGGTQISQLSTSYHHNRAGKKTDFVQGLFPNWFVNSATGVETAAIGDGTFYGSIEYPIGVALTQIKWNGIDHITVPGGSGLNTPLWDRALVPIEDGDPFLVHCYQINLSGVTALASTAKQDTANGEALRQSTGLLGNQTMTLAPYTGGTNLPNTTFTPYAIVSNINVPTILLPGDSRQFGVNDIYTGTSGDKGSIARCIGPYYGYANLGLSGDTAVGFLAGHSMRLSISQYFSHVINEYGFNDLVSGNRSAAQMVVLTQQIQATLPGKRFFIPTIEPYSTSTGNWTTTADQTRGVRQGVIDTYNGNVRAGIAGVNGYFELANIVSTAQNSGIWITSPLGRQVTDATAVSGLPTLTSIAASFTSGDTGGVAVCTALGFTSALARTMTFVDASNVTMSGNATATLSLQTANINAQLYTIDGIHDSPVASLLPQSNNLIPPTSFTL